MDISLSEEDKAFQQEVREFLEEHLPKGAEVWSKRKEWFEAGKAKGGWDVPKWPKEFGGPGWNASQHYIWDRETCDKSLPLVLPFGQVMLAPILMNYGSKEQQEKFLPDIRDHKVNWCQGYSEPGAGSDLASLKTKAELNEAGTHYVVNGTKIWTTMGHIADWMFCLTRTQTTDVRQEGITFLLIDMKTPGIEVKPIITLGGSHHVNQVFFDNVEVPVENRVGEEGKGWTYAKGLLQHERSAIAGISRTLVSLQKLKRNALKVKVGDGNLMDDNSYRKKLAEAEIDLRALEFTELRSLAGVQAGGAPGSESSILKLKGTIMQQRVQELTIEAAGPYAINWGHAKAGPSFSRMGMEMYLNGRAATVYGGCSEVQKDVISKRVLGLG
ncbi:MAG TPA: pimeloyl-CoA dehydrogenase large subunit [Gammaproteobacteria bacterium]|nr:pimeloyl-CoA dehydrogenase large subunit [Gammaproteobacteria bacterium]